MNPDDRIVIVCARADAPRMVPGSVVGLKCAECGRGVMMAPSGQRALAEYPDARVVCGDCMAATEVKDGDTFSLMSLPDDIMREIAGAVPSPLARRSK